MCVVCVCVNMCRHIPNSGCFVSPTSPSGFDELTCHCGASVIYPPVPCGTRPPECTQTCARVHECDHPGGSQLLPLHLTACLHCVISKVAWLSSLLWGHVVIATPCSLFSGAAAVKVSVWSGPQLGITVPSISVLCGCHTHLKSWENLHLVLPCGDFSSFLIASNLDVYFVVEHLFAKLKATCFLLLLLLWK